MTESAGLARIAAAARRALAITDAMESDEGEGRCSRHFIYDKTLSNVLALSTPRELAPILERLAEDAELWSMETA